MPFTIPSLPPLVPAAPPLPKGKHVTGFSGRYAPLQIQFLCHPASGGTMGARQRGHMGHCPKGNPPPFEPFEPFEPSEPSEPFFPFGPRGLAFDRPNGLRVVDCRRRRYIYSSPHRAIPQPSARRAVKPENPQAEGLSILRTLPFEPSEPGKRTQSVLFLPVV